VSRADLHCHSTASQLSRLGVQRALGLPECATPPEEVYALAKRRGMDFVTITDHDTIAGVLEIADRPDVFISEELTAWFKDEPQAVHILCYGITPDDHDCLQERSGDLERCAAYLRDCGITCALAHPFYDVAAPLEPRHRRRLAELFGVWEVRNGARPPELNAPAAVYVETYGAVGIAGSDDHAGVDVGRTFTETPTAGTPAAFLAHVRAGHATDRGDEGSAAKWAHAAMAIAARSLGDPGGAPPPDPRMVLVILERVLREGDARSGALGTNLGPDGARALLRAWLDALGLPVAPRELLGLLQDDGFSHADLFRRARTEHERRLAAAVRAGLGRGSRDGDWAAVVPAVFNACVPAVPYAPAAAFLGTEKRKLRREDGPEGRAPRRVALVADGVGAVHGVTRTLAELRARGVPGFEVEIVGTDPHVDRRLGAVAELDVPFYPGLHVGVPSVPGIVEVLAEGRYDLVHLCTPGPSGAAAALVARVMDVPVIGSYHTELAAYARLRAPDAAVEAFVAAAMRAFYGQCRVILSPSTASDGVLARMGVAPERVLRWDRGVDAGRFRPDLRVPGCFGPGDGRPRVHVLYAGRLTREKGAELLADAFLAARARDPRLHLVLAGGGPEERLLHERVGEHATFLGWLEGEALARAYASADIFLFPSRTDTFGQVVLEAQAGGLAVVAVGEGGPRSLVEDGVTGLLRPPEPLALAGAVAALAADPDGRAQLARRARAAAVERTWARALERLADGYRAALAWDGRGLRRAA
jgi:glycosyltransferase involved in cell wall biosynthesis/predicted metal-dependent phosphoesterase TrpH